MIIIRPESQEHRQGVREVEERAFGRKADLVDRLRARKASIISRLAVADGDIVGHGLFSPVSLREGPQALNEFTLLGVTV